MPTRRELRSYRPEVKEELRLREELKRVALPTAAYCRKSVADTDQDSIENQVYMVRQYIEENPELNYVDTYVDDGISGTTYERPDWQRMMNDVTNGRISCIVMKDLSRCGRNFLQTQHLIENILPKLGVRVITILDDFDSTVNDYTAELMVPVKNIFNDFYARDASRKISISAEQRKMQGKINTAPYGYRLENDTIVPDPAQAPVVRMMFTWADLGVTRLEITNRLNLMKTPPQRGERWDAATVQKIMENEIYTGILYTNKYKSYLKQKKTLSKDEWYVFENHHEPIVDKELFERVNAGIDADKTAWKEKRVEGDPNPLRGLIICGVCGKPMTVREGFAYCRRHTGPNAKGIPLSQAPSYPGDKLRERLIQKTRRFLKKFQEMEPLLRNANHKDGVISVMIKEATVVLAKKAKLEVEGEKIYDDYNKGKMTKEAFMEAKAKNRKKLKAKQAELNRILSDHRKVKVHLDDMLEMLEKSRTFGRLSLDKAAMFVDKIVVGKQKGEALIKFKYEDDLKAIEKYMKGAKQ